MGQSQRVDRIYPLVFAVATFASAFLLFLVQPVVGKRILPWFGGAPSVWTLCLAVYQSALFAGYAYAHLLVRFVGSSRQLFVHGLLFLAAALTLPVLPSERWQPDSLADPSLSILGILTVHVVFPFIMLSATGPLLQAWFARSYPDRSPYPLYAVSNLGSMLALLSYPTLVEPRLALSATGTLWSIAFVVTGTTVTACGALAPRASSGLDPVLQGDHPTNAEPMETTRIALWLLLPACAVVLLMGVTNRVCLDLASVPFLWILPLVGYLSTFIVCFASERAYVRPLWLTLAAISCLLCYGKPLISAMGLQSLGSVLYGGLLVVAFHLLLLVSVCMVLHGELYRLRPPSRSLTTFYLCVAGGGALGGIFVGIAAPILFAGYTELPLGILLAWILFVAARRLDDGGWFASYAPSWHWLVAVAVTAALVASIWHDTIGRKDGVLHEERGFFGALQVTQGERYEPRRLVHGETLHGAQFQDEPVRDSPTAYYGVATGIATALTVPESDPPRRIGVVGLGVGTLASYGRAGDSFRFYEIDRAVTKLATTYFSFLDDSAAEITIVIGDGRLALAQEQALGVEQDFDVLVVDAFSSDAIPVHLLTREAFEVYAAALSEGGLLAVHVTNRFFDLIPVVVHAGQAAGLDSLLIENQLAPKRFSRHAKWIFLSRAPERLQALAAGVGPRLRSLGLGPRASVVTRPTPTDLTELWTDDYSDLLGALR